MVSDSPTTYDPTTIKINFPPELNTAMDILLKENSAKDAIKSEARAALGDKISKFASHFSTPSNMWTFFDAMKAFTATQPSFSDQFNYTNQLALILDSIPTDKTARDEEITKLIADFKALIATKSDQIGNDVATWVTANGENITPIHANLLQIVLEKVGFPLQQKSWADVITILQNKYCIILHTGDNNWMSDVTSSLLKVVPSELNNQGLVELVTLLQFCITMSLDMQKFQDLVKNILADSKNDVNKTVRISLVKLILKVVQLSLYSSKFVIPVDFFKMMREIRPTEAIVNFTGVMMSYVREILQNCKDTGYVEEMVDILSYQDLEGVFIGDVVVGMVDMMINQLHPIDSKAYPHVFKALRKNNGKLTLSTESAEKFLKSAQHVLETINLDKFAQLVFQLIEICAGSEHNFAHVDVKNKFVSDFGRLFQTRFITAVKIADAKIVPLCIFCTTFMALIQLGFNGEDETFTQMCDFQAREFSKMVKDDKTSYRHLMAVAVEKWHESLAAKIGLDLWKNLLKDEHFDDNGTLAHAILTSIPFSEEAWDFILQEVVWKETPSREDHIYRALITLANNSKFPRSRVASVVQHHYCKLTLLFLIAWINNKKNEKISPEVEQVLKFRYGTKYATWMEQHKQEDSTNLLPRLLISKVVNFAFLKAAPGELELFFDMHEALINRAKGGTFSSEFWVKWMAWQIIFVFEVNIPVGNHAALVNNVESVKLGLKLLLDLPMERGTPLEVGAGEVKLIKWQLDRLKGAGWAMEEVKGDIGKVQDKIAKMYG